MIKKIHIFWILIALSLIAYACFTQPEIEEVSLGAPSPLTWEELTAYIYAEQETLLARYGGYVQITEDGRLLYKNGEINENRFKNSIPDNIKIIPYEGPSGVGFQIIQNDGITAKSFAIGPEAAERTYEVAVSTTTDSI